MNTSRTPLQQDEGQHLLLEIARMLVDDSDSVRVDCFEKNGIHNLNLYVSNAETGKLIGKDGRTARCLRIILSAVGMKFHRRYQLNIEEDPAQYH